MMRMVEVFDGVCERIERFASSEVRMARMAAVIMIAFWAAVIGVAL